MKAFAKNRIWPRTVLQIFFFVLIALIAVNHTLDDSGVAIPLLSNASLHAVCPFGGVVSLYQFATAGTFTQKIRFDLDDSSVHSGFSVRFGLLRLGVPSGERPGVGR